MEIVLIIIGVIIWMFFEQKAFNRHFGRYTVSGKIKRAKNVKRKDENYLKNNKKSPEVVDVNKKPFIDSTQNLPEDHSKISIPKKKNRLIPSWLMILMFFSAVGGFIFGYQHTGFLSTQVFGIVIFCAISVPIILGIVYFFFK